MSEYNELGEYERMYTKLAEQAERLHYRIEHLYLLEEDKVKRARLWEVMNRTLWRLSRRLHELDLIEDARSH